MPKLVLLITMVGLGISNVWVSHEFSILYFNNLLMHCIFLGIIFGVLNYLLANWYFYKQRQLKNQNKKLKSRLVIDNLTGLFNRRALDQECKSYKGLNYSIIFMDIDNFRGFNNQYGHKIGDKVLRNVSEIVKTATRSGDRAYRYGGEEIVLVLKECAKENALRIAEKIRTQVSLLNNAPYPSITISLGLASCSEDGEAIQNVMEKADLALLQAKSSGKNRTVMF